MSDNANAVGSITVNQAAQSFASMLDSQEGVDTGAEAQPEEEQSESESEEMESAEPQDQAEETSEEVEGEDEEAEEQAPKDEKFIVKVDGKEIEVPKDELIRGYQREADYRSEEHTSELQSHHDLVCRLLLEKKKNEKRH